MSQLPPSSPTPSTPPPANPAAPAKSGNRTLLIILGVLGGLFLLFGGCVATCVYYGAKKTQEFSAMAERNPAYATLSIIASLRPDVEIVSKDETTGIITIRNKKNQEIVTLDTKEYTAESIGEAVENFLKGAQLAVQKAAAQAGNAGKALPVANPEDAAAHQATLARFPVYVSVYPDAATNDATFQSAGGVQAGTYSALTRDQPAAILDFYEKKLKSAGFSITAKQEQDNTGMLSALASSPTRNVTLTVSPGDEGGSELELSFQQLAN